MDLNGLGFQFLSWLNYVESQVGMNLDSVPAIAFEECEEPHLTGERLSVREFAHEGVLALFEYNLNKKSVTYWKWMRLLP
jgi:hypothetical protein